MATVPVWVGEGANYSVVEDTPYYHNLSRNVTGNASQVTFAINIIPSQYNLTWTNASGTYNFTDASDIPWITIQNSSTGNLSIDASHDNQTGYFVVPIQAENSSTVEVDGSTVSFKFKINATNDAPNMTNIPENYSANMTQYFSQYINATDEEEHYPLVFNVSFNGTCTHASWSGRNANENCSLIDLGMNFTSMSNLSYLMNFTPTRNDVGIYWMNISVMDAGANYNCPHTYCHNATYELNQTIYHSSMVLFSVYAALEINASNCTDKVFQENEESWCIVNITTKGEIDNLNISSFSILRNYAEGTIANTSWFFANNETSTENFFKSINITLNASKQEIGNWTINFTVEDMTFSESSTSQINFWVNRSSALNDAPDLINPNFTNSFDTMLNVSINNPTVVNLSIYDDDLLIPDKNDSFGGFNETTNITTNILNKVDLTPASLSNFSAFIVDMPVFGTNRTSAEIRFTATIDDVGNYTINVTATDVGGEVDWEMFNITIINNTAPTWNSPNLTIIDWENNNTYLNLSRNVSDIDGDTLTFSHVNDTAFPSFSLDASTGVIDITTNDSDVGQHIVNITISDGHLTATESFNFTIKNVNDSVSIENLIPTNATPNPLPDGNNLTVNEDNYTTLTLFIQDDDLRIPPNQIDNGFYNETFTVTTVIRNLSVTSLGNNSNLFNFTVANRVFLNNRSRYTAIFTPTKEDLGAYNVSINITDLSGFSTVFAFNMTITEIDHDPVLESLGNVSSAVNRSIYFDLNVTDTEDGNDTSSWVNTNFTYAYEFLSGVDFIGNNQTIFNATTGIMNYTFNATQDAAYNINITVNDSSGREDHGDFWIFVYGSPEVSLPSAGAIFNLTENITSILNFTVNHSVGNNLTYEFYVDSINYNGSYVYTNLSLRNRNSHYGNASYYNWSFTPNFTDESYSKFKNLTLVVYSNSSDLVNASVVNTTINFNLNISHTNYPVQYISDIPDMGPVTYDNDLTLDLTGYFLDFDYTDAYYNQTVNFTFESNGSTITQSVSDWALTLSASIAVVELMNMTAIDSATTNVTSAPFRVEFVAPTVVSSSSSSSSGSGTTTIPVSLKLILPDPVSAYQEDRIELPITLHNTGTSSLSKINLSASVAKDGELSEDIDLEFTEDYFASLSSGQKVNTTLTAYINTEEVGLFEITVNADVRNPVYNDWGKLYLTIQEGVDVEERILFTEEFIVENPECVELTELVEEAKEYASRGETTLAIEKANQAINACKEAISQASRADSRPIIENKLYRYLIISTLVVFFFGIGFYSYKRMKLRKKNTTFIQQHIKNQKYLK